MIVAVEVRESSGGRRREAGSEALSFMVVVVLFSPVEIILGFLVDACDFARSKYSERQYHSIRRPHCTTKFQRNCHSLPVMSIGLNLLTPHASQLLLLPSHRPSCRTRSTPLDPHPNKSFGDNIIQNG